MDLRRKLRIQAQTRSDILGVGAAPATGHSHPTARLPSRDEGALAPSCAFEEREYMVAEWAASADFDRSAADWIAVAVNIGRSVGSANHDRDRSARAALRMPVVIVILKRAQHFGGKVLRREHQSGIRGEVRRRYFAIAHHYGAAARCRIEKQLR